MDAEGGKLREIASVPLGEITEPPASKQPRLNVKSNRW